jgi:chemotaxis protein histidine kinase CheA
VRFGTYLKAAFLNPWNLLAFLGAMGFAILTRRPDVIAPLVVAGEVIYLGLLGSHPKFQRYVEAQAASSGRQRGSVNIELTVKRLLAALPAALVQRFEALRNRCVELRQIAQDVRDPQNTSNPQPLEELHLSGLDRLLWIYLRLLYTQHAMERFLHKANGPEIQADIQNLENRVNEIPTNRADQQQQKIRKALEDNLETSRTRLANFQKAQDNYELVKVEIDRLEDKIRSLSEVAINRQETDFISVQVDQVASSMAQTERTMGELQFITGLDAATEDVPQLLQRETISTRR